MRFNSRRIAVIALTLCTSASGRALFGQNNSQDEQMPVWLQKQWSSAHNHWQRTPVDISRQSDTVSANVRAKRNAYWMQPLQQRALRNVGSMLTGLIGLSPEVREIEGFESVWVVARFEALHVFAIDPDSTLIYTEENMRVIDVLKSPDDLRVSAGSILDVQIPGGALKTPQGAIHSLGVDPKPFEAQVGDTYLLHLLYNPGYGILTTHQRWEISSGRLLPDDRGEAYRAKEGESMLVGKSIDEATKYLQSLLKAQSGK